MSETSSESWDGLLKNYLKAENIPGDFGVEVVIVCIGVEVEGERMDLVVEYDQTKFNFTMNKTNMVFLKENDISRPKDCIGKKITVKKSVATNPTTRKEVSALRISKIE